MARCVQAVCGDAGGDATVTGDAALPSIIASLVAASLCVLSGCGNPERVAESSAELNKKLSDQSRLSNMNWEEIRTIGIPLAVRQAITEKCFGTSHGEFSNYLYDLTSVGVPDELIEDIRESGGYMAQNVTCDNEFIQVSEEAAALAQEVWRSRMKIERMIQAREQ